jgi:hypothetical protein
MKIWYDSLRSEILAIGKRVYIIMENQPSGTYFACATGPTTSNGIAGSVPIG